MAEDYREKRRRNIRAKRQLRIGNILGLVMLLVAIAFDVLQIAVLVFHVVPIAGTAVALVLPMYIGLLASWIIFPIWFRLQQVQMLSGWLTALRVAAFLIPAVLEFVSFVNALPLISTSVLINLILVRLEDVFKNKERLEAALRNAKNPPERRKIVAQMRKRFFQGRPYEYESLEEEAVRPEPPRKGRPESARAGGSITPATTPVPANDTVPRPFDRSKKTA